MNTSKFNAHPLSPCKEGKSSSGAIPSTYGRGLNFLARNELRNSGEGKTTNRYKDGRKIL